MSEERSPAAQELGQHFQEADCGFANEGRRSHSTETVTISQLEHLENARSAPALEQHLRPGGPGETEVHHALHTEREGQITHVVDRLCSATEEMSRDFERGRRFERKRDFERPGRGQGRDR